MLDFGRLDDPLFRMPMDGIIGLGVKDLAKLNRQR
jgi:hypothetical protein